MYFDILYFLTYILYSVQCSYPSRRNMVMVKLIVLEMREGKGFLRREHETTTPTIVIRKDMVFYGDANLQFIRYVLCNFVYFWCMCKLP